MPLRSMKESSCFLARDRAWTASVRARQRSRVALSLQGLRLGCAEPGALPRSGSVDGRRDVDGFEFASAQQAGELLGVRLVRLVRLDLVAGFLRDLRGRDDDAVVAELHEAAYQDEAGGSC